MRILILLIAGLLSSCSTNVESETVEVKQFSIKTKIYEGENVLSQPQVTLVEESQAIIRVVEELYIPISWKSPNVEKNTPSTPVFANPKDFGVTLETKASKVKIDSPENIIHIQGRIILNDPPIIQNPKFHNNDLLLEHLGSYSDKICNYSLFFKNGTSRKINFKAGKNHYTVEFTVSEIDPSKLPKRSKASSLPDFRKL